jgi:hypothetical protein
VDYQDDGDGCGERSTRGAGSTEDGSVFEPPSFHPDRPGLVAPVGVDPSGVRGPTRKQARGPRWRRSSYGRYVPSTARRDDVHQRIVEASAVLRPGDAVTGWAALSWLGGRWFAGEGPGETELPVPLVARQWLATQSGLLVSQEHLRFREVQVVDGLPVTPAARSVTFEMRHAPTLLRAVMALDMACYSDLVSIAEAAAYAATLGTWTGIPLCRKALAHADENSWSPQEVVMRWVWTQMGSRPRPLCNVAIFDRAGRHVGTPDLLDPVAGVVGEYDGAVHLTGGQRTRDLRREGELRGHGLEYVTMIASDAGDGYRSFLSRLDTAYTHARHQDPATRSWTTVPPRWWTDTTSVEARRRLSPAVRARLLQHRLGSRQGRPTG